MKMKFFKSTRPFGDFVVTSSPIQNFEESLLESRHSIGGITVLHNLKARDFKDGAFFGIGLVEGNAYFGPRGLNFDNQADLSIVKSSSGQFAKIEILPDKSIRVSGDYFGLVPLYFYREGRDCIVSNRLHLMAISIKKIGKSVSPSIESLAGNWFAEYSFGLQQATDETLISNVHLMRPGEAALFKQTGAEICSESFEKWDVRSEDDYRDLIKASAAEIKENILAAASSKWRTTTTLTGGQDSRVVMAGIIALGLQDQIPVRTNNIDLEDSRISSGLVKHFNAHYDTGTGSSSKIRIDPSEAIAAHRSLFFGSGHDYRGNLSADISDFPELRMIGGCGELYRGFYQNRHPAELMDMNFSRESLISFLRRHKNWNWFPTCFMDAAFEGLYKTFSELPGYTLSQKLDWHYFYFRNRYHFGVKSTMRMGSVLGYSPLSSKTLHQLSHSVSEGVRLSGRVVFDLTVELCEEIAFFPYHRPVDLEKIQSPYYSESKFSERPPVLAPDINLLKIAADERSKRIVRKTAATKREMETAIANTARKSRERILGDEEYAFAITDQLAKRTDNMLTTDNYFRNIWMSRLAALSDTLDM